MSKIENLSCSPPPAKRPRLNSFIDVGAATDLSEEKFTFQWRINNLKFFENKALQILESPIFSSTVKNKCDWCIQLSKRTEYRRDFLLLAHLKLVSSELQEIEVSQVILSVCNDKKSDVYKEAICKDKLVTGQSITFPMNKTVSELINPGKILTISCKIIFTTIINNAPQQFSLPYVEEMPTTTLSNDLKSVLEDPNLSDVTLKANGQEFRAHKIILSARSPVFSAMFQHNMAENKNNLVEINDVAPKALKEMLHFIYTDEVVNIAEMSRDLLILADKYDIKVLKAQCEIALCESLTINNVFEILSLAHLYNAEFLKNHVLDFAKKFGRDIIATSEFKALESSQPSVMLDLFRFIVSN